MREWWWRGLSVLTVPKYLSPPPGTYSGQVPSVLKPFFLFNAKNGIDWKQNQVQEEPGSVSGQVILGSLPWVPSLPHNTLLAPNRPTASWPATTST